jgi:two-component system cell cycle sensor histidine kinase/response regulator CckA
MVERNGGGRVAADDGARLRRVLIVEDDNGLRNLILKSLHKAGHETDGVANGAAAIDRVMADPDLVLLLDQKLPDMAGSDIINTLNERGVRVPFVVMTGQGDERLAVEMMKLGASDYLVKTLDLVDLLPGVFQRLFRELDNERQLHATEQRLKESEKQYRSLFEAIADTVFLIDQQTGSLLDVNPAATRMYGFNRDEFLRMTTTDVSAEPEKTDKATREPVSFIPIRYHRHKDGSVFPVELTASLFELRGRNTIIATARGIAERMQAEAEREKLEVQNRQLQKSESLGRMAGAIAHTFNNQLGAVIGNLELAIDSLSQGTRSASYLTAAMKSAQKAAEVSSQMLTYLGQSFDKRMLLDLAEVCRRNLPILEASMPGCVAMETALPSPGPAIMANTIEIQQVFTNLITNAWEAVGAGRGSIHLSVKTVFPADIPESHRFPVGWAPQNNGYACLEVMDTGSGIADNDMEYLFDPFYTSRFTGRGLGLPVALGIVKAHDGAITVESQLGRGSTFRVFLPLSI